MCEIAILNPDRLGLSDLIDVAKQIYASQRSALGLVAVYDENGSFRYEVYRAVDPIDGELWEFMSLHNDCYRLIVHGRMATSGARDNDGTHPIPIDCPECDVDWVLHNGIVSHDGKFRNRHENDGHEYSTEVDTEVIAHEFGTVPEGFELPKMVHRHHRHIASQPCYILLNEERIFIRIRSGGWSPYDMTGNVEVFKPGRWWNDSDYEGTMFEEMIVTPSTEATDPNQDDSSQNATANRVVA